MKFLTKLERKLGKYAIENLPLYLIACYVVGYVINIINEDFILYLTLNPFYVVRGQVWRLFTWVLIPPSSSNIFYLLITLMFYYSIGKTLERTWGAFYFNVYVFGGMFFTVLASAGFALYECIHWNAFNSGMSFSDVTFLLGEITKYACGALFTTYYINLSMFLAFALTYPDLQVLLMFIIPIKVKYLGIVYAAMIVMDMVQARSWLYAFTIVASLLNFIIFFLITKKNKPHLSAQQKKVRMEYRRAAREQGVYGAGREQEQERRSYGNAPQTGANITRHKCAICGQTERDNPDMQFRFCSKCEGNYEYCQNHLFTHEHVHRS